MKKSRTGVNEKLNEMDKKLSPRLSVLVEFTMLYNSGTYV